MSELTQILQAFDTLKDDIKNEIKDLRGDIKGIKVVLAGDEFGNKGLVDNHNKTVERLSRLRDDVKTIKVIGSVLYAIIGIIIGGMAYFSKH